MQNLKISNELVSEVLGYDVIKTDTKDNTLRYDCDFDNIVDTKIINIYEFAFKCKEWAYKKGYSLVDGVDTVGSKICYIMEITGFSVDYYYEQTNNYVDVFNACEWILSEANK